MSPCTECAKINPPDLKSCTSSMDNSADTVLLVLCVVLRRRVLNLRNLKVCGAAISAECTEPSEWFMNL
jgi:hypothetical protein